jgi:hypothetical protein
MSESAYVGISVGSTAHTGTIDMLPVEILGQIFRECIKMRSSIWDLVNVSERWKMVAFTTHDLWTTIRIAQRLRPLAHTFKFRDDSGFNSYYYASGKLFFDDKGLQKCLSRCGEALLDLQIEFSDYSSSKGDKETIVRCLKGLMDPSVSQRIKSLTLWISMSGLGKLWPECFSSTPFHSLETLNLRAELPLQWRDNLSDSISKTTTRLRTLSVHPLFSLSNRIWLGLRSLHLFSNSEELNRITPQVLQLDVLTDLPIDWPNKDTPNVRFPNLRVINISSDPFTFLRVQFPALEKLEIRDTCFTMAYRGYDPELITFRCLKLLR